MGVQSDEVTWSQDDTEDVEAVAFGTPANTSAASLVLQVSTRQLQRMRNVVATFIFAL